MRHSLNRRRFFGLAALGGPALAARAGAEKQVVFVPQAMPDSLDPIATPSFATRTASAAVLETLYGTDAQLNAMPQMVERHRMEDDGRRWLFQLRAGLLFHDGTRVTARDCIASLSRWMRRDRAGKALAARLTAMEAAGDDTLVFRLAVPLPRVPQMLTKSQMSPPVIMPARLAESDAAVPVGQIIGSGPFRLDNVSWRPGDDLDLVRFDRYQPRPEASSFTGGGRRVLVDRVLWRGFDDPIQALKDGRADWVEWVLPDQADGLAEDRSLTIRGLDEVGYYAMLRLNTFRGLTANQRIRQAILAGVDQTAVMEAVFGVGSGRFKTPLGLFPPGSESASSAGMDRIGATESPRAIKARLKDAGYNGERFVILDPVDDAVRTRLTAAVIEELTQIGITVEARKLGRAAFDTWRQSAQPDDDWSGVCDSVPAADHYDPLAISAGPAPSGDAWPGWPDDKEAAQLREAWIDASDLIVRRTIAGQLQTRVFTTAAFVPLGQWFPTGAWRSDVTGQQKGGFPVFWDIARP